MSKLSEVRNALNNNSGVVVVGAPEFHNLPSGGTSNWSHKVDIHVAPKVGVYTAGALQKLMTSLVPGVEPTSMDEFDEYNDVLKFGLLYFDEEIGREIVTRDIKLSDPDMFKIPGFVEGECILKREEILLRRTWVRVYPDILLAGSALEGKNKHSIGRRELKKHCGVVARLRRFLNW